MCGNEQTTARRQLKLYGVRFRSPNGAPPPEVVRYASVPAGTPLLTLPAGLMLSDGVFRDGQEEELLPGAGEDECAAAHHPIAFDQVISARARASRPWISRSVAETIDRHQRRDERRHYRRGVREGAQGIPFRHEARRPGRRRNVPLTAHVESNSHS